MLPISISSKLTKGSYIKLMYLLTYRKPVMIFCTIAGAGMLILSLLYFAGLYMVDSEPPYIQLLAGLFMAVYMPILVYRNSIKTFRANKRLQEKINYQFDLQKFSIQGDSFNSEMYWAKTHNILELKHWILIYQDQAVANLVPMKSFTHDQRISFKKLIQEVSETYNIPRK